MSQASVPRTTSTIPRRAVFAGVLLMISGVLNILQGITAIAKDDLYVHIGNYAFKFSTASWGWIHLILGILLVIVGWGAYAGATWARITGVVIIALAMIGNFMWLPYQTWWALTLLAIDGVALWSLIGRDDEPLTP
ncbi:MAG: hypothetical protein HOV83_25135 [Catenulispora sp.]|nr:hypothetical protein [Catenulispora sp.]